MTPKPDIDLVVSGAGSHVIDEAGAAYAVASRARVRRALGTSAGGLAVLALAFGVPAARLKDVFNNWLVEDRLLDGSVFNLPTRYGWAKGDRLREASGELIGKNTELGEAGIPVGCVVYDYYTRQPRTIATWTNPRALACDVAVATAAIPGVFGMQTIRGLDVGNRLHGDGGSARNFAMDEFDDLPERPTIGIRCLQPHSGEVRPVRSMKDAAMAIGSAVLWASDNAHLSSKKNARIIEVPTVGSGLDFDLSEQERTDRWRRGWQAGIGARLVG